MPEKIIKLNPCDQLAITENELRTVGRWMEIERNTKLAHYFIAKNPKIETAISFCHNEIQPFSKLHEMTVLKKCLVCSMWADRGLEVRDAKIERME